MPTTANAMSESEALFDAWIRTYEAEYGALDDDSAHAGFMGALASLASGAMTPPPGWRLVPEELTLKMLGAAQDCADILPARAARLWEGLLTAAPPAPVAAGWIRVDERLPILAEENEDDGVKVWTWDGQFVTEDEFVPIYEQPAGPTVGGWLRTDDWFASDNLGRVTHWMPRVVPLPPSPEAEVSK